MILSLIVAMTEERVIGKNNQLPWHLSEDLKRFKKITMGHPIIMGRKTFESIGKPLPGRQNIVISRNASFRADGVAVVHSLVEALAACPPGTNEAFVIGGASIYEAALPKADRLYLTLIHRSIPGDATFPPVNLEKDYRITEKTDHQGAGPAALPYSHLLAERLRGPKKC